MKKIIFLSIYSFVFLYRILPLHAAQIDYLSLDSELNHITRSINPVDAEQLQRVLVELDNLLTYQWLGFSKIEYSDSLLKIAQIKIFAQEQIIELASFEGAEKATSTRPPTRIIKCSGKSFKTTNKKVSDALFCQRLPQVMLLEKKAAGDSIIRRGAKMLFGDDFFDLSIPDRIVRVAESKRNWDKMDHDPFALWQFAANAGRAKIAAEAKRKMEERERREKFDRWYQDSIRRERAEWTRERIDRSNYRIEVGETTRHTA